jgi:hypothetical protein
MSLTIDDLITLKDNPVVRDLKPPRIVFLSQENYERLKNDLRIEEFEEDGQWRIDTHPSLKGVS